MYNRVSQVFPSLLVVVMVVAKCVGYSLATSAHHHALNQHEVLLAITVNQMALLKEMNASSSVCASRESELRELRRMKEAMKEAKSELEGMKEELRGELQALVREMMAREMKEVLNAVRNASLVQPLQQPQQQPSQQPQQPSQQPPQQPSQQPQQPSQQPPQQPSQQPPQQPSQQSDLYVFHNDTYLSLCDRHKVLHGSRGSLSPSHPHPYPNNKFCRWKVILPEGTRPVFTWEYFDTEPCGPICRCDWVMVWSPGAVELPIMCGNSTPTAGPMYNIMENEFLVAFRSDGSDQRKGFVLHYAAELVP